MLRASCVLAEQSKSANTDDWPPPLVRWARGVRVGDQIAKALLLLLVSYADPDGSNCFPCVPTLARDMEVSERTVQRKLKLLEEERHIFRDQRYHPKTGMRVNNVFVFPAFVRPEKPAAKGDAGVTANGDTTVTPPVTLLSPQDHHITHNTPLTPHSAKPPRRRKRREEPASAEPIVTSKPNEGWEAGEFRKRAAVALGETVYRWLLDRSHIARVGDGLLVQVKGHTLFDEFERYRARLGPIARAVGCPDGLQVEAVPSVNVRSPHPNVAHAARQAEAVRDARARTAEHQAAGQARG